jgi:hypothetical protein
LSRALNRYDLLNNGRYIDLITQLGSAGIHRGASSKRRVW